MIVGISSFKVPYGLRIGAVDQFDQGINFFCIFLNSNRIKSRIWDNSAST